MDKYVAIPKDSHTPFIMVAQHHVEGCHNNPWAMASSAYQFPPMLLRDRGGKWTWFSPFSPSPSPLALLSVTSCLEHSCPLQDKVGSSSRLKQLLWDMTEISNIIVPVSVLQSAN